MILQTDNEILPFNDIRINRLDYQLRPALPNKDFVAFGIDPGQAHMGAAAVFGSRAILFEIALETLPDTVERIMLLTSAMQYVLSLLPKINAACIEGAAYMAPYGQVPLETARTTATISLLTAGVWPCQVVPPATIRKTVFLNWKYRAQEMWPEIPENAASALGCAFFAYKTMKEELSSNKPDGII